MCLCAFFIGEKKPSIIVSYQFIKPTWIQRSWCICAGTVIQKKVFNSWLTFSRSFRENEEGGGGCFLSVSLSSYWFYAVNRKIQPTICYTSAVSILPSKRFKLHDKLINSMRYTKFSPPKNTSISLVIQSLERHQWCWCCCCWIVMLLLPFALNKSWKVLCNFIINSFSTSISLFARRTFFSFFCSAVFLLVYQHQPTQ